METKGPVEIAKGVFWVGKREQEGWLACNPYLLVDEEEAVIIDPGSVLDFEDVFENVTSLVPLEKVKYCVVHHQDPDFCSAIPLLEKRGARFVVVTHWRAQALIRYYGITSGYYIINENEYKLVLKSGRVLRFIPTPYLHFPGAFVTYDECSKILFSSDLFGAFSPVGDLYADEDYLERMKAFHEHYMPSNDILRPVMEGLLFLDISMIAPQHGSIINKNIASYIKALRDLECGSFMRPVKKSLVEAGGFRTILTLVLKRYAAILPQSEVLEAIKGLPITLDPLSLEVTDYEYTSDKLWNLFFETILAKKGMQWLLIIEPFVSRVAKEYDIPMPQVFTTTLKQAEEKALNLTKENLMLKEIKTRLEDDIRRVQDKLTRCPITGLYNQEFFWSFLVSETERITAKSWEQSPCLMIVTLDNAEKIRFTYGEGEVNDTLKGLTDIMLVYVENKTLLFRLEGPTLAYYIHHTNAKEATDLAERIRNEVAQSGRFIEPMTVSIGLAFLNEVKGEELGFHDLAERLYHVALARVGLAKEAGGNSVINSSSLDNWGREKSKVLVVEPDEVTRDILKTFLEGMNYSVFVAEDGEEALRIAEKNEVKLIISEVMLPKIDGLLLRESLLSSSKTKDIPFILLSHLKDEPKVIRAAELGVEHYFKKPVMLPELLGVVHNKIKGEEGA